MPLAKDKYKGVRIHETAIIEDGVEIGEGSVIWDNAHIRKNTRIGKNCIIGEKTYIAYNVQIGNLVKINSFVYICTGVSIEDMVMISAGTVFTNDKFPRATLPDLKTVRPSDPDEETLSTIVKRGATIGANATIGPGIKIGEFSMVGMGSVVAKDVSPFQLVYGVPAQLRGYLCVCGTPLLKQEKTTVLKDNLSLKCKKCRHEYNVVNGVFKCITL